MPSTYSATRELAALRPWACYFSAVLFLGAEFTQVDSEMRGDKAWLKTGPGPKEV